MHTRKHYCTNTPHRSGLSAEEAAAPRPGAQMRGVAPCECVMCTSERNIAPKAPYFEFGLNHPLPSFKPLSSELNQLTTGLVEGSEASLSAILTGSSGNSFSRKPSAEGSRRAHKQAVRAK